MPATQRGQAYRLGPNRWGLRYYDAAGARRRKSPFASKSAALAHYRGVIEPQLRGDPAPCPKLTLAELVDVYLERHAAGVRPRTIATLRERLAHKRDPAEGKTCRCATCAFGDVPLRELERMSGEIASWQAKLPERSRYGRVQALRQTLEAAVRWGYIQRNPAKLAGRNRQPAPRFVRTFTREEVDAIAAELSAMYQPLPVFAAATGLRPEEWQPLERRDIDRVGSAINLVRTVSDGEVVELGKTSGARRQVPLTARAREALDGLPPRLDTPLLFPGPAGGLMNLDNFRRREWAPEPAEGKVSMKVVVAVLATILIAGVGSVEAARLVTGATIKNNSVTGRDIKNGSLTIRDFKSSERRTLRGPRGPAGVPGAPGAKGTTDITYVDGPVITIGPGASEGTYAECPAGSVATGGGIGPATQGQLLPIDAYTISGGGFGVFATNPDTTSRTLQARAACARR